MKSISWLITGLAIWLSLFLSENATAQEASRDFQSYTPRIEPNRIADEEAPQIDGRLSDAMWAKAAVIDEFYQVEPSIGPPSVETRVYLAYDSNALYVGIEAFDDEAENIFATILERDGDVWRDDMVRFYIDPFDTGITGFGFDVNALGARAERLVQANRMPIDEWDAIWDAAGQITEEGWTAEIVLPFRSISFDPEADSWGLMLTRERAHKREEIRWAGIDPAVNKFGFARAGRLGGIEDVDRGTGLDVQLLSALKASRDWERPRDDDIELDPSANILYRFTPSLAGLVSLNTDFSDTPLDTRQINTGRFSLFFPETRDFFLQDAAFFEFGGQAFARDPNGRPFFSRRIGIVNGEQITLEAGGKLSGEIAGVELGLLTARMGEGDAIDAQTLSVARASYNLNGNSRIGAIATNGDPRGLDDNTLLGLDYLYQTENFLGGGGRLQADVYYQRTVNSEQEDDDLFGARLDYPNDRWNWSAEFRQIGEEFRPALGFVNRPGTRNYDGTWFRRFRPSQGGLIRWWQFGSAHEYVTDLDGTMETRRNALNVQTQTSGTDELTVSVFENYEFITQPFTLPTGIIVPVGEYQNDGASLDFRSSWLRAYGVEFGLEQSDFFGGDSTRYEVALSARPNPHIDLRARASTEDISVPNGDVTVNIASLETVFNVSTDLSVSTQTQYDNISEGLSFFGRVRYELRPETEVFLSLGHGAIIEDSDFGRNFESIQTQAILRLGNTFRF
ncbi:MAG: carbohydrate binding family 9 domain-containing protein [Pseudomonadota bacterium]